MQVPLLSLVAVALSVGVSNWSSSAQAETGQATDSLYACVGYYNLFSKVPDVDGIRKAADQKRTQALNLIMKVEGSSVAVPNRLSKQVETAFMNKVESPEMFATETAEVDKSCMATIDQYTSALSTGADLASIAPSAALAIIHDAKREYAEKRAERRANISDETRTLIKELATCVGYFLAKTGSEYTSPAFASQMINLANPLLARYTDYYDLESEAANISIQAQMHYAGFVLADPIGFERDTQSVGMKCGEVIGTARLNLSTSAF